MFSGSTSLVRCAVIGADPLVCHEMQRPLPRLGYLRLLRRWESYPAESELLSFVRASEPQVILLSVGERERALEMLASLREYAPGVAVVAVDRGLEVERVLELVRAGARDCLALPLDPEQLEKALRRIAANLPDTRPPDYSDRAPLFTFLPARPGTGTSTLAVNVSRILAESNETLLLDLDLNNGTVGCLLELAHRPTVYEAASRTFEPNDPVWPSLVTRAGSLEVLPSGRLDPASRIELGSFRRLFDYVRGSYGLVCADLSGNMERYSVEALEQSSQILLVCAPEITSVRLAAQKIQFLRSLELQHRIRLIISRTRQHQSIPVEEIEAQTGVPVACQIPPDFLALQAAIGNHPVPARSKLGRAYDRVADLLLERESTGHGWRRWMRDYLSAG